MKRYKLGKSSKLHSARTLEDISLRNACCKNVNRNTKLLAHTSLVRPTLEVGSVCWDSFREGRITALDRVQTKSAQFTNHTKDSDWETLAQRRTIARLCALFKA
jgi:hypothetical protein